MKKEPKPDIFDLDEFYTSKEYRKAIAERASDSDEYDGPDATEYDSNKYHHSTCQDSKCTTCDRRSQCDVFAEACSMANQGIVICMFKCKYYSPIHGVEDQACIPLNKKK